MRKFVYQAVFLIELALCALIDLLRPKHITMANAELGAGTHEAVRTFDTAAAITTRHLLYKQSSATAIAVVTAATDLPIGTVADEVSAAELAAADGNVVAVQCNLLGKGTTKKMVTDGTCTVGAAVYLTAAGKVASSGSVVVGTALTASATDGDVIEVQDVQPAVNSTTPGIAASMYDAHTILYAVTDNTPVALTVGPSTIVGRKASGNIVALTGNEVSAIIDAACVETVAATNVITAAETGKTFFLSHATEFVSTLPAPAAGLKFTFIVAAAPSGASYTIVTGNGTDLIHGCAVSSADAGGSVDSTSGTPAKTIAFVDGQAVVGDRVDIISDGTYWYAFGVCADEDAITFTPA